MTKNNEQIPNIKKQGWDAEKIVEESSNKKTDDTVREMLRGDATEGNPDKRDIAGSPETEDTPHGREEEKHETQEKSKKAGG